MWAFYSTAMGLVALAVALLLRRFAAPKVSPVSLIVTALAWLTALSVVALVPIDVFSTLSHQTAPDDTISTLWSISYWSTQVLTWAVIPTLQGYSISGAFTIWGRFLSALKRNLIFYLIVGTLSAVGILSAWLSGHLRLSTLPGLVFTLSNTYGLIVCILLLGYGLVEIPRVLWRRSFPEKRLRWHYHRVGRAAEKLTDASTELEKVLAIMLATAQQVPRTDTHLRRYVDLLLKYVDEYSPVKMAVLTTGKVNIDRLEEGDLDYANDVESMARLRGRMKQAIAHFLGCRSEYSSFVKKAMDLEAICKSRQHGVYAPPSGETGRVALGWWWYKCQMRPWVQRLSALLAAAVSAVVVWSEATIGTGTDPDLSPFSLLIHSGAAKGEFMNQALVAAPLTYICACAYFSLFKLGNFGFYHMVGHATWAYSLLLSGSLLCRFAAPLCFNFLHVIRMNEYLFHGEQMVFIQKMKGMNDVPVLGQNFNTWFPLTITIYCGLLYFNLWEKCASKLFISSRFRFDTERADDEHTSRGMRLVQLEQEAMSRGYPLGDGIGLFGVGSLVSSARGKAAAGGKQESSMELNATSTARHASRGNLAASSSRGNLTPSGSPKTDGSGGSPSRPPLFAPKDTPGASGSIAKADSLHNVLLKNKYGSTESLPSLPNSRSGAALAQASSQQGSPKPQQAADAGRPSEIDDMFASVQTRKGRGQDDVQRLVDSSAEPSVMGFTWKRGGR